MFKVCLLAVVLVFPAATASAYTVEAIPNVHAADSTRFLSNPDGIISAEAERTVNSEIADIWRASTAEVAAVVVKSIGDSDIDVFATELFRHWGIGKEDKNNGLLILVVTDQRRAVIRTGYGAEGLLPDIVCGRIIRNKMVPFFRKGDYDGGLLSAVSEIRGILTTPGAVEELRSKYGNNAKSDDEGNLFVHYAMFAAVVAFGMLLYALFAAVFGGGGNPYVRFGKLSRMRMPYQVAAFLTLGMGLPGLLVVILAARRCRNKRRVCQNCKAKMRKLSEEEDNAYLTPAQDLEERINSVDYDVWICDRCGEIDVFPFPNKETPYQECPVCHAKAAELIADRLVQRPTMRREGKGVKTYRCRNCGRTTDVSYTVPQDDVPVIVPFIGGFGSGRGGGFGGFGGGSFGGGSTGGGGASGGW